jgi:hypothetical protein
MFRPPDFLLIHGLAPSKLGSNKCQDLVFILTGCIDWDGTR